MRSNWRSSIVAVALILSLGLCFAPALQAAEPIQSGQERASDDHEAGYGGWMSWILETLEGLVFGSDSAAASTSDCTDCTSGPDSDTTTDSGGGGPTGGGGPQPTGDGLGGLDGNG